MDDIDRILADEHPDGSSDIPAGSDSLLVSKKVLRGAPVLVAYRDEPEGDDSGWVLLSGTEPEAWLDDRDRFEVRDVAWALDLDDTLDEIFGAPPESCFERERARGEWVELEDDDED